MMVPAIQYPKVVFGCAVTTLFFWFLKNGDEEKEKRETKVSLLMFGCLDETGIIALTWLFSLVKLSEGYCLCTF